MQVDNMAAKSSVPAKNKPPARNKHIMDLLQASIVAEKQQPKKEIKAKIVTNANLDQSCQVVSERFKQDIGKRHQGKPPVSQFSRSDFSTKTTTLKRTESTFMKKPTHGSVERPLRKVQTPIQKIKATIVKSPPKFHQPPQPAVVQAQKEYDSKLLQQKMDYEAQIGNEKQKFAEEKQKLGEEKQTLVDKHSNEIQSLANQFEEERNQFNLDAQKKLSEIQSLEAEMAGYKDTNKQLTAEHVILEERIRNMGGNKNLQAEIDSLKYELELKTLKINELKSENSRLTIVNNSILAKDIEIRKLQHRNQELSSDLSQQRDIHRVLTQQLENARIDGKNYKDGYESLLLDNEGMRYRLNQAGHEIQTPSFLYTTAAQSPCFTSPSRLRINSPSRRMTPTQNRTNSASSVTVGNATTPTRNGTGVTNTADHADDLTLLSVYKEQGIKRSLSTPTKIYAPEGTFEVTDAPNESLNASRRVDLNTEEQDTSSEAGQEQEKGLAEKTVYHL